jgi:hypothetical protein
MTFGEALYAVAGKTSFIFAAGVLAEAIMLWISMMLRADRGSET